MALENALAELYRDRAQAERVVNDAGMDASAVAWEPQMIVTWHNILAEARHQRHEYDLLGVALGEYPRYQPLIDAVRSEMPQMIIPVSDDLHERVQYVEKKVGQHETSIQWIMRRVNPSAQRRASLVIAAVLVLVIWSVWMISQLREWLLFNPAAAVIISLAFLIAIIAVLWLPGGDTG